MREQLRKRIPTRESAKLQLRTALGRVGVDIGSDPFAARVARTLTFLRIDTVMDVGANQGQYGHLLRGAGFDGRLISYEPLDDARSLLSARARRDRRWDVVGAALGRHPAAAQINVSANSYSSSLLPMTSRHLDAAPDSAYHSTQEVELRTVDGEVERMSLDPQSMLLKIDTQGYEEPVLEGAAKTLTTLPAIQLELSTVDLYQDQARAEDLLDHLTGAGFLIWNMESGISDGEGRLLQYDALFVRSDRIGS